MTSGISIGAQMVEGHLFNNYIRELDISKYPQMLWKGENLKW